MTLPASFYSAEAAYLEPPYVSQMRDDWESAQEEKKDLMKEIDDILQDMPMAGVEDLDELDDAIETIRERLERLEEIQEELDDLEERYPADYDFDGDDY